MSGSDHTARYQEDQLIQAQIDANAKLSAVCYLIASDPDFHTLNKSNNPLMDEIGTQIAEGNLDEAWSFFRNWKETHGDGTPIPDLIDQKHLDACGDVSLVSCMIASDPDFEVLLETEGPFMDVIATKIAEKDYNKALKLYQAWKKEYRNQAYAAGLTGDSKAERIGVVEDYSDDFEGEVKVAFFPPDSDADTDPELGFNDSDSEATDDINGTTSTQTAGAAARSTLSPPLQVRSAISGDFYEIEYGYNSREGTSTEPLPNGWYVGIPNIAPEEFWPISDAEQAKANLRSPYVAAELSFVQASIPIIDDAIGAVEPGVPRPQPAIIITRFKIKNDELSPPPFFENKETHNPWCECIQCTLYKMKQMEVYSEPARILFEDDIDIGAVAISQPPVVITDYDRDLRAAVEGERAESIVDTVVRVLQSSAHFVDQDRIAEVEEIEGGELTSKGKESEYRHIEDDGDYTASSIDGDFRFTSTKDLSTATVASKGTKAPNAEIQDGESADKVGKPEDGKADTKTGGADILGKIVAAGITTLIVAAVIPKWVLAGVLVGLTMSKKDR